MTPLNVLLVDDRSENLLALRHILLAPEYRLLEASSGQEALQVALRESLDIILLDVVMPGMDGFEVAASLKQIERTRHVPIIFLTALATDMRQFTRAYDVGAVDYLIKPLEPDLVRRRVAVFAELVRHRRDAVEQSQREYEIRLAEMRLASDRRYRRLVEGVDHALAWTLDDTGGLLFMSRQASRILGHSPADVAAPGFFLDHVHPDDRQSVADVFARVTAERGDGRCTHRMITADCRALWFFTCVSYEPSGATAELHGISTDITEVKRAEELQTLLADVGSLLSESLELDDVLPNVARRLLPALGDWCMIDVIDALVDDDTAGDALPNADLGSDAADCAPRCVAAAHIEPERDLAALLARRVRGASAGPGKAFGAGASELCAVVPSVAWLAHGLSVPEAVVEGLGAESCMFVPVTVRGRTTAVITWVASTRRRFCAADLRVATELAARVGLAIDSAHQYRAARRATRAREDLLAVVSHDLRTPLTTITMGARALELSAPHRRQQRQRQRQQRQRRRRPCALHGGRDPAGR